MTMPHCFCDSHAALKMTMPQLKMTMPHLEKGFGCRWMFQKAEDALLTTVMKIFDHLDFAIASQAKTCCEML